MDNHIVRDLNPSTQEGKPYYRPRVARKNRRMAIVVFFILLFLAFSVYHLIGAGRVFSGLSSAQEAMNNAEAAAVEFDFREAQEEILLARDGLEQARSGVSFFSWLHFAPWLGDQIKAVGVILDAGVESLSALEQAIMIADDVYSVVIDAQELLEANELETGSATFETLPQTVRADLLRTLHRSLPELQEAQVKLVLAQDELDALDDLSVAPQISEAIDPFRELLPELIAGVDFLVPFAATVGELTGVDANKQWLVLFMNDMEMRPGGGFLGVYGLVTVRDGDIQELSVSDTYAVDVFVQFDDAYQLPPPAPLQTYIGVDKWYFRDGNWSPDFPTASRDTVQLLRQELAHGGEPVPEVHGVFGLTPTFGQWILDITGPIDAGGNTYTSENLPQLLEFEVEFGFEEDGIPFEQRKDIVGELVEKVVDRLLALPFDRYGELFETIEKGFTEKHIGLYAQDEQTQLAFMDAGWAGELDPSGVDDVLLVVDANMAALKTDPKVQRHITYTVQPAGDDYHATVAIEYNHVGTFDKFTTRYRTFTRVYAPLGSELISHSGSLLNDRLNNPSLLPGEVTVADDLEMTSFGAFTSIEPGTTGTLTFTYKLPPNVAEAIDLGVYELAVLKQMGAQNHALTLDLDFGKKVRAALPPEDRAHFGDSGYTVNTTLDQNSVFIIEFE